MTHKRGYRAPANGFRARPRLAAGVVLGASLVGLALLPALPAAADPAAAPPAVAEPAPAPITADAAKQAWIDAARRAEAYHEQVLGAEAVVAAARTTADQRAAELLAAEAATAAEEHKVAAADAVVASFQQKLNTFANASFRGARLSELSVLLTAASPEDYLDQATALGRVAEDQENTLRGALDARNAADTARAAAAEQELAAGAAKTAADTAIAAAEQARVDLETGRAQLDAEIAGYQLAYAQLSAGDRAAAVSDVEAANVSAAAQARQAEQAAQRSRAGLIGDPPPASTGPEFSVWAAGQAPSVEAGIAVAAALGRQGLPYVWAAEGPDQFDCSSLMQWSWRQAGVEIPRNSAAQAGLPEIPLAELQPGDLVTYYSPVSHVGMYVGDGLVVHASMPGVPIKVVPLDAAGPDATGHAVNR